MKLIVGLGNPGSSYAKNRHNVGFTAVDALAAFLDTSLRRRTQTYTKRSQLKLLQAEIHDFRSKVILAKPAVFMNDSGIAVGKLVKHYKIALSDLIIIHDDLDIALGEFKIQKGKGPKDHNGVLSVEEHLKTDDFVRVRIGIENREKESRIPGEVYVLQNFGKDEEELIGKAISKVVEELYKLWL